jgi:hypothetical protein
MYEKDAARLAVNRINLTLDAYTDSVKIKPTLKAAYLNALLAVYNATSLPERDSVISIYKIHRKNEDLNTPLLTVDTNYQWTKNLRTNVIPTGNIVVDSLMSRYYLQKSSYKTLGWSFSYHLLVLKTDTNSNLKALNDIWKTVPGVFNAQPNYVFLDGNKIEDVYNVNFIDLIYSRGWDDCPSGCINRRFWEFRVYNNCNVEFLGSYGTAVDVGVREQGALTMLRLYPQPAVDHVAFDFQDERAGRLEIFNAFGQLVGEYNNVRAKELIDISFLSPGLYFMNIQTSSGEKILKLIKE